jgi:hypothetical protein
MTDYANGFKDGFAAGLEEGKKMNDKTYTDGLIEGMKKTLPPPYVPKETCPKCGITIGGVMGYVCSSVNCPTFYQTYSYGAVGYMSANYEPSSVGANGPVGTSEPPDNNSVWVNGSWVSLGN